MNFDNKIPQSYHLAIKQSNVDANISDEDDNAQFDLENWSIDDYRFVTNWNTNEYDGWKLPGTEEEHWWCGNWKTKGCIHVEDHNNLDNQGLAWIRRYQQFCFRGSCRNCFTKWLGREANAGTKRLENFAKQSHKTLIHVVLSVSKWDVTMDFKKMKEKARGILERIGIRGGVLIFHPFRFNKKLRIWYYSPHFHTVCFGEIPSGIISTSYYEHGWPIIYLGTRKSVFRTMYYLLAHCGIKKKFHSVSWFGILSYGKVKKEREPTKNNCPQCGRKLVQLYYEGVDPIPNNQHYEGYLSSEGWHEVKYCTGEEDNKFEYSPFAKTNEVIKSITC